jgi:hypothetical protein
VSLKVETHEAVLQERMCSGLTGLIKCRIGG